jgi:hypothetical protein
MTGDIWPPAYHYELGDIVLVHRIERRRWWQFWRPLSWHVVTTYRIVR